MPSVRNLVAEELKIFALIHGVLCIQWGSRDHEYREKKSTVNKLPKPKAAQRTLPATKGDPPHYLGPDWQP
jgi:hypothetical protein